MHIATAIVGWASFSVRAEPPGAPLQRTGSEVSIQQPPKNALEKREPASGKGDKAGTGDGNLEPTAGPEQPIPSTLAHIVKMFLTLRFNEVHPHRSRMLAALKI